MPGEPRVYWLVASLAVTLGGCTFTPEPAKTADSGFGADRGVTPVVDSGLDPDAGGAGGAGGQGGAGGAGGAGGQGGAGGEGGAGGGGEPHNGLRCGVVEGCEPSTDTWPTCLNTQCFADQTCVLIGVDQLHGFCSAVCDADVDCNPDPNEVHGDEYRCVAGQCLPGSQAPCDFDAAPGEVCGAEGCLGHSASEGPICQPLDAAGAAVGEACDAATYCQQGNCLDGVCRAACVPGVCPEGQRCRLDEMLPFGACLLACAHDADCPQGSCAPPGVCQADGLPGGAPCEAPATCASGACEGGACVRLCADEAHCGPGERCLDDPALGAGLKRCVAGGACAPCEIDDPSGCGAGLACTPLPDGARCLRACDAATPCPEAQACVATAEAGPMACRPADAEQHCAP